MIPRGLVNLDAARRRWGDAVDRYAHFFDKGDPLADAVVEDFAGLPPGLGQRMLGPALDFGIGAVHDAPPALRELFAEVDRVPCWVDWQRLALGARTFQRTGIGSNVVLSCVALMTAYRSSVANKPLVFTGQLEKMAQRRLAETGRYVVSVCQPSGLRRWETGFKQTIRVRLVHAKVRRMLSRSDRWDREQWGSPINQANMSGTTMLFSYALLQGLRRLGFQFSRDEADALMHVWRYAGWLNGVNEELLFDEEDSAAKLWEMGNFVQPNADDAGRALARALSEVPAQHARNAPERAIGRFMIRYMNGMTRALNGDEFADDLGIGDRHWRYALVPTRAFVGAAEALRRSLPAGTLLAAVGGNWAMHSGVAAQLRGREPDFGGPDRLDGARRFARRIAGQAAA